MAKSGQSSKSPDCICLIISAIRLGNVLDIVKVLKFAFLRNDTFPRCQSGHRLHRPLWLHLPFPPPGKVPGFSAKTVHFPPWPTGVPALQVPLAALGISTSGESAGFSCENGSLSPAAGRAPAPQPSLAAPAISTPRGKCRVFPRKRFTFPAADRGTDSTAISRSTRRFHLRGKCR